MCSEGVGSVRGKSEKKNLRERGIDGNVALRFKVFFFFFFFEAGLKFFKKLYSGVGHGAVFLLVLMTVFGVLFGITLHIVNVPPTYALVYFV